MISNSFFFFLTRFLCSWEKFGERLSRLDDGDDDNDDDDDDLCEDDDFHGAFVQLRETGKEEEQTGGTGQFKINLNTHVEADFQGVPDSSIMSACGHRYFHFIDLLILSLLQACPISPSRYIVFLAEKMYQGRGGGSLYT